MKKLAISALLLAISWSAQAQEALVVATCGTPPTTYTAGQMRLPTVDVNGKLCLSSSGGSTIPGGSNTQIQFNDNGTFAGATSLTLNKTTGVATSSSGITIGAGGNITSSGPGGALASGAYAATATAGTGISITGTATAPVVNLALTNQSLLASPSNPTGTTSTAVAVMMGLGVSSCRITPAYSSRLLFVINGSAMNNTASDAFSIRLYSGSGAGPANGAALTGTALGSTFQGGGGAGNANVGFPFSATAALTGLTPGTTYWFDIALQAIVGGTASISGLTCTAIEF